MGLFYKSSNIYLVKVGVATKALQEGSVAWGILNYTKYPEIFIAEIIKTDGEDKTFKLLSSGITLSDDYKYGIGVGSKFVAASIPFNKQTNNTKKLLSKKYLLDYEKQINESIKPNERLDMEKDK